MFDLITRIAKNPFDYIHGLQTHTLVLKKHIAEGNNVYSFIFEPTKPLQWKAGQHAIFRIPDMKIEGKSWRVFSIASAPSENEIRITTTINDSPSSFKSSLKSLTFGSAMLMTGPFGEFHIGKTKTMIGIASGVGITPFRSIIKEISNKKLTETKVHLLYAAKNNEHTYKEELEEIATNPLISIEYFNGQDEAVTALKQIALSKGNEVSYYVSGSPRFINVVRDELKQCGIRKIVNDPFKGY